MLERGLIARLHFAGTIRLRVFLPYRHYCGGIVLAYVRGMSRVPGEIVMNDTDPQRSTVVGLDVGTSRIVSAQCQESDFLLGRN